MTTRLSDEEFIKKQERLYELESSAMAGPFITEEDQMEIIRAYLADDYFDKLYAKVKAKKRQLISAVATPEEKKRLEQKLVELERTEKELAEKLAEMHRRLQVNHQKQL